MKSTLSFEKLEILASNIGPESSLPSVGKLGDAPVGMKSKLGEDDGLFLDYGTIRDIFPYKMQDLYDRSQKKRKVSVAVLENEHIKAIFIPELGGKLWSLFDKDESRELLFRNSVIQPCNLALRNAWTSGGVEWNCALYGHTPFTCSPLFTATLHTEDGTPVLRMYEYERIRKITYQMDFYIPENSKFLHCRMRIVNPNNTVTPMYWWSNIAVPEDKNSRVVVPASEAYTSELIDGDRYVFKLDIPYCDGFDATYPTNTENESRDYFYRSDSKKPHYIAYLDKDGYGLLQTSTSLLKGRKLFVWGQGSGAQHWKDYLSQKDKGNYVELQAGLAYSQYEHLPMPPNTAWEWIEVYGAVKCNPHKVHGDFAGAQKEVEKRLSRAISVDDLENELISTKQSIALKQAETLESKGSGWGSLETELRKQKGLSPLTNHLDFGKFGNEQSAWSSLLKNDTVGTHDPEETPQSWMLQSEFTELLISATENADKENWYAWLQLGTVYMIENKTELALSALKKSVKCLKNCWAFYCLAVLSLNTGDMLGAKKYALAAVKLKGDDLSLNKAVFAILNKCEAYGDVIKFFEKSNAETTENGRAKAQYIYALAHSGEYEKAFTLLTENGGVVLTDVREEEVILSDLYVFLTRAIAAKNGEPEPHDIDIPRELDFRVKPEDLVIESEPPAKPKA